MTAVYIPELTGTKRQTVEATAIQLTFVQQSRRDSLGDVDALVRARRCDWLLRYVDEVPAWVAIQDAGVAPDQLHQQEVWQAAVTACVTAICGDAAVAGMWASVEDRGRESWRNVEQHAANNALIGFGR